MSNTGTVSITVSEMDLPEGFTSNWSSGSIAAGANQVVTLTFNPTQQADYEGYIVIHSDATTNPVA